MNHSKEVKLLEYLFLLNSKIGTKNNSGDILINKYTQKNIKILILM